jgi:hypothetical protein
MYLATFATVALLPFSSRTRFAFGNRAPMSRISRGRVSRTMIETIPRPLDATSSAPRAQRPVP